jgi:uncharacterized protein (TIGR03086 family)
VRDLVNHLCEGANWFGLSMAAGKAPDPDPTHGVDYAAGDVLDSFDVGVKGSLAAFGAPGALDRLVELPFGTMPGGVFLQIATSDVFTHAWDLAKATGQPTDLDAALAESLLAAAMIPDEMRGDDASGAPFGQATEAPAGAHAADRLAAYMGRIV